MVQRNLKALEAELVTDTLMSFKTTLAAIIPQSSRGVFAYKDRFVRILEGPDIQKSGRIFRILYSRG